MHRYSFHMLLIILPILHGDRSSCREPVAIFKFLEALYQNFDDLAEQHGVFKVETVRDSYGRIKSS